LPSWENKRIANKKAVERRLLVLLAAHPFQTAQPV
jgi:hypothetical protein